MTDQPAQGSPDKTEELRKQAFELSCHEQFRLASFIAENVGYWLAPDLSTHPDDPHVRALAEEWKLSEQQCHTIGHARYQVERASPDHPDVSFDYELVKTLLEVIDRQSAAITGSRIPAELDSVAQMDRAARAIPWRDAGSNPAAVDCSQSGSEQEPIAWAPWHPAKGFDITAACRHKADVETFLEPRNNEWVARPFYDSSIRSQPETASEDDVSACIYRHVYAGNDGVEGISDFIEDLLSNFEVRKRSVPSAVGQSVQ